MFESYNKYMTRGHWSLMVVIILKKLNGNEKIYCQPFWDQQWSSWNYEINKSKGCC